MRYITVEIASDTVDVIAVQFLSLQAHERHSLSRTTREKEPTIIKKTIATAAMAVALGGIGMATAQHAAAAPGLAVGGNGADVGIGDAQVNTSPGNYGLAFGGGVATAETGTGNIVIAGTDATATVTGGNNNLVVAHEESKVTVNGNRNVALATGKSTYRHQRQ